MPLDKVNRKFLFEKNGTKYYKATKENERYKKPQIVAFTRLIHTKEVIAEDLSLSKKVTKG